MKTLKEIRNSPFKPPKKNYYFGKIKCGVPYFLPINFNSTIFSFRKLILKSEVEIEEYNKRYPHFKNHSEKKFKNLPMSRRCKDWIFSLFGNYYWLSVGYPICFKTNDLAWKDKFNSPRFEWSPAFYIFFFEWQFCIWWNAPDGNNHLYYEMYTWYKYYCDGDIEKAEKSWIWQNTETKLSTWNNKYLK